jgi:aryl-alcohol dehydrogenase-like predicted oxidoreductase
MFADRPQVDRDPDSGEVPSLSVNYRKLGRFGIRVSEVSVGGWLTQGRSIDDDTTHKIVRTAFDLGVNFFDTADAYNAGEAELSLGKSIVGIPREDLVLATKCYFPISDKPNDRGLGRKHVTESVHKSLKRLGTDYIDLMQFHRFDTDAPLDETVRAIDDLIRQGKVLYWGVSEWTGQQITDVVQIAEKLNANPPASNQPRYSILARGIEKEVVPVSERFGIGQVVFSPLAQGILTGKYLPGAAAPSGTRGADDSSNMFMRDSLSDQQLLARVQKFKAFAESHGHTISEFSLAWCLRKPIISSVITGASSPEQVVANVKASGVVFDEQIWNQAEAILDGDSA